MPVCPPILHVPALSSGEGSAWDRMVRWLGDSELRSRIDLVVHEVNSGRIAVEMIGGSPQAAAVVQTFKRHDEVVSYSIFR